jgi:putative drug exporter of the RND superfamily
MRRIAHAVLAHRWLVLLAWVVVLVVGLPNLSHATGAFSQEFSVPGREGFETNAAILRLYGIDQTAEVIVPVVTLPEGKTVDSPGVKVQLAAADAKIAAAAPGARVASYPSTGNRGFVSADGRTTFALVYPKRIPGQGFNGGVIATKAIRSALGSAPVEGQGFHVTGIGALSDAGGSGGGTAGVLVEALVGGLGALLVLAFVFASFVALVPILMAAFAIVSTFMLLWFVTTFAQVSFIVTFLVALIGLGVAIDYALLIVMRWREERDKGHENDEAIENAMATAGSAVVFSGTTVAIGLLALIVLPVPFLRSIGYAGMLIPLVSVIVALTALPAILSLVGPRLEWPRARREDKASPAWTKWGQLVVRRRWIAAAVGLTILFALAYAATGIRLGNAKADALAKSGDARQGLVALERSGIGPGPLTPFTVLVKDGARAGEAAKRLALVKGVRAAVAPADWTSGGTALVNVFPDRDANTSWGRGLNSRLKQAAHEVGSTVGGSPAQSADFVSAVYGSFPLMIALVSLLTFLLLARAFRSLLLPLKAVALNLLSVAAAWGVLVLIWQYGWGSHLIWGIPGTGAITEFIPLMVFAFLFGLSMDYEVFILARVREAYDENGSTDESIILGIGRTGRLVTSAALILFLAFAALASGPQVIIKIFATGLAAGIILDATVVRALTVPALVSLFGRWNWWLPRVPARLLRVRPSEAVPEHS